MPFSSAQTAQQISDSIGAMLLLNSSCQALIQASIAPSVSPWYSILDQELGQAENLVVGWRQSGYRYFQDEILGQIVACGKAFTAAQAGIDSQFLQLEQQFDSSTRDRIVGDLKALGTPVQGMIQAISSYSSKLATFDQAMAGPYAQMNQSIAEIQAEEADIQQQITQINAQIAELQKQVQADRAAIAKAEAQRTEGIIETIFGVLLTPLTGGASLILAGIGVGTIAEAQDKVSSLESTISQYQANIVGDQQSLSSDQLNALTSRQVAALTTEQVAGLEAGDLAGLTAAQFAALTTAQLAALTADQAAALEARPPY